MIAAGLHDPGVAASAYLPLSRWNISFPSREVKSGEAGNASTRGLYWGQRPIFVRYWISTGAAVP